jgi:hypothetical protein
MAGGALGHGGGDLPRLGVSDARARNAVGQTGFYDVDAGRADGMVILIALAAHHHHFILHASGVGQARHFGRVEARHTGGGAQQECGRGARGDDTCFGTRGLGDYPACGRLNLGHVDAILRGLLHDRRDFGRQQRTGDACGSAFRVDDCAQADRVVNAHCLLLHHLTPAAPFLNEDRVTPGRISAALPARRQLVLQRLLPRDRQPAIGHIQRDLAGFA